MEEKTINLMDLAMLAWRRLWIIAIAAVVCASAAFGYCKIFLTPSYSATASILVTNGAVITSYAETTDKISGSDIQASLILSYTVVDILNTPDIYIELADELGDKTNYQGLKNKLGDENLVFEIGCDITRSLGEELMQKAINAAMNITVVKRLPTVISREA